MTARVAVLGFTHETNTYADAVLGRTDYEDFRPLHGGQILEHLPGTRTYLGGMLQALEEAGAQPVPITYAAAQPSGTIEQSAYERIKSNVVAGLHEHGPFDAVVMELHGAAVTEGLDDAETDLAAAVRGVVGPAVPVVAGLDLHGNLLPGLALHVEALLGVQSYPHVDMYERGQECVALALGALEGRLRPTTWIERLPMLLPATYTGAGPGLAVNGRCAEAERVPGVLDCTFFHGFPWVDVPIVGSSVVVTTDGDPGLARSVAADVARWVWDHRDDFRVAFPAPAEAVRQALDADAGLVVINETNDNAGGGAPADGTHLLRALHEAEAPGTCFGFVCDPEAVQAAISLGVRGKGTIAVGGKHGGPGGAPVELDVRVRCLTDGRFRITSPMARGVRVDLGPTALLQAGTLEVIITTGRNQTFDPEIFLLHGVDVRRRRVVAVKSQNHFRAGFEGIAYHVVTSDAPGITTAAVASLPRERLETRVWPLHSDACYP